MYDHFETLIECRLASGQSYHKNTKKYSIDDLIIKLDNPLISYNEIIQIENKLFFDIDDAKNALNFKKCLEKIESYIFKFRHSAINVECAYTQSTSTTKPHSYHVVY